MTKLSLVYGQALPVTEPTFTIRPNPYAYERSAFYREVRYAAGVRPADIRDLDGFARLIPTMSPVPRACREIGVTVAMADVFGWDSRRTATFARATWSAHEDSCYVPGPGRIPESSHERQPDEEG